MTVLVSAGGGYTLDHPGAAVLLPAVGWLAPLKAFEKTILDCARQGAQSCSGWHVISREGRLRHPLAGHAQLERIRAAAADDTS